MRQIRRIGAAYSIRFYTFVFDIQQKIVTVSQNGVYAPRANLTAPPARMAPQTTIRGALTVSIQKMMLARQGNGPPGQCCCVITLTSSAACTGLTLFQTARFHPRSGHGPKDGGQTGVHLCHGLRRQVCIAAQPDCSATQPGRQSKCSDQSPVNRHSTSCFTVGIKTAPFSSRYKGSSAAI